MDEIPTLAILGWEAAVDVEPVTINVVGEGTQLVAWHVRAVWGDYHGARLSLEARASTIHEAVAKIERQKANADATLMPASHAATAV